MEYQFAIIDCDVHVMESTQVLGHFQMAFVEGE